MIVSFHNAPGDLVLITSILKNLWLSHYRDPMAYFKDIVSTTSDESYQSSRSNLYTKICDHPSNLFSLYDVIHKQFFDRLNLTVDPFTYRQLFVHVREAKHVDEPDSRHTMAWNGQLASLSPSDSRSHLCCDNNRYAASYPSPLSLLVHCKSSLIYYCSWDKEASTPIQPSWPRLRRAKSTSITTQISYATAASKQQSTTGGVGRGTRTNYSRAEPSSQTLGGDRDQAEVEHETDDPDSGCHGTDIGGSDYPSRPVWDFGEGLTLLDDDFRPGILEAGDGWSGFQVRPWCATSDKCYG